MVSPSRLRPKCYEWSENDFAHGVLQAYGVEAPLHVDFTALPRDICDYFTNNDRDLVNVVTKGDGACGVHAVFGEPSKHGALFKEAARGLASALLGPNPEALQLAGVESRYVAAIGQSFWNEFVKPVLDKKTEAEDVEAVLFWKALQKHRPGLVNECRTCHSDYARVTQEYVLARQVFLSESIFLQLTWSCVSCGLWR